MEFTAMARGEITGKKPVQTADEAKRLPGPPGADATVIEPSAGAPEAPADAEKPAQTDDQTEQQAEPSSADSKAIEPTTKSESDSHTKGKATPIRGPPVPPAWYSVREFCLAHRLSISMYFKLKAEGRGPRETAVGSRRYISFEDAAKWRAQQQEVTAHAEPNFSLERGG
jgi:hypothetical protein